MAARRAACLADQARRVARRRGHDLPLPARKPLEAHRSARRSRGSGRLARLAGSGPADRAHTGKLSGPLPRDEFERIFSRVPRLTVELVIASSERGVLLALRDFGPCAGLWHLPGGTVRFGEPVVEAVRRVAQDELGLTVSVGRLLGYIEYPSHTTTASIHPSAWRSARRHRSSTCPTSATCDPSARGSPSCPTRCTTSRKSSSSSISTSSREDRLQRHDMPVAPRSGSARRALAAHQIQAE